MAPLRVAVVADLLEENWPSMNLVAEMLVAHLAERSSETGITAELLRPRLPAKGEGLGRYFNRFWGYGRWLRARAQSYDVFHIVDHSYAHLAHVLPRGHTVVTCHDVDAFLPVADPVLTTSKLPEPVVRILLAGLRRAARVVCVSRATYEDLRRYDLVAPEKLEVVYNGTQVTFSTDADPEADSRVGQILGDGGRLDLLHVGTTIPRKRIDRLLRVVAAVRDVEPRVRLIKAGGALTAEQRQLARQIGLEAHIVELPFLDAAALACVYRRAAAVLVTSDREGFGLPIIEALASGTRVVVTDLPVLREIGGTVARYCQPDDMAAWRHAIEAVFRERANSEAHRLWRADALARARRFSWDAHARAMARIYRGLSHAEKYQADEDAVRSAVIP